MRTTRPRPFVVKLALLLVIALVANYLADFALGAYATLSGVAWEDFRAANRLDCVFVGSSYAERAFDPTVYDEVLGGRSVNLSTPGQMLSDSCDAAREAIDEKGARRIVVGIGIETFTTSVDPYSCVPFLRARYRDDPVGLAGELARLACDPEVITTKSSLNVLFPWTFTSVHSVSGILDNVQARIARAPLGPSAEKVIPGWHYVGQGYGNYDRTLDPASPDTTVSVYGIPEARQDCLDQLRELCMLCRERGVELVVVATPHPAFDLIALGEVYPTTMGSVRDLVEGEGAHYVDLSLARDEVLSLALEDFGDYEHLNFSGARLATRALADIVRRRDAGEDVSSDFYTYDEWDAWVADHAEP